MDPVIQSDFPFWARLHHNGAHSTPCGIVQLILFTALCTRYNSMFVSIFFALLCLCFCMHSSHLLLVPESQSMQTVRYVIRVGSRQINEPRWKLILWYYMLENGTDGIFHWIPIFNWCSGTHLHYSFNWHMIYF